MNTMLTKSAKRLLLKVSVALVLLFAVFGTTEIAKAQSYCNPYNRYLYGGYIRQVHFYNDARTIDWSYSSGYSYYSYVVNYTNAGFQNYAWSPGDRVNLEITLGGYTPNLVFIWIDWNNDGDFRDAGEHVFNPSSYGYSNPYRGSFTIPSTAPAGKHRMRVNGGYAYYTSSNRNYAGCRGYYFNEYEDYTLSIAPKNDAGVAGILSPTENFNSDDPQDVQVQLKNFSKLELYSADIVWSLDGVQQGVFTWNGTLEQDQTTNVTIATGQTFTPQDPWDPFRFEAWTDPNSLVGEDADANTKPDGDQSNDKASADIQCILNDAGFVNADPTLPIDFGENDIILRIKNYAPKPLSRVTINWSVDGVAQQPYTATFNPPIARGETADVTVGTYFFGAGNIAYLIEAETSNPNGVEDQVPANDAGSSEVYKALQGGTYTVGPRESDYETLVELMEFIGYWGIAGPVDVLIREGTYYASFVLRPRSGTQFPLSFESISRRPLDVTIYNDGSENDYIFQLDAYDNITFRNLTFEAPGTMFDFMNGNDNVLFDNCVFNGQGITAMARPDGGSIMTVDGDVSGLEISNSEFNGGLYSIFHYGLYSASNWWIHDNEFNNASMGFIYMSDATADYITVENNLFNGSYTPSGFVAYNATNTMIMNNRFNGINAREYQANGEAIMLGSGYGGNPIYTGTNEVTGNTISVVDANGVYISMGSDVLVADNVISANGGAPLYPIAAIYDDMSSNTIIHKNTINVSYATGIQSLGNGGVVSYNKVFGMGAQSMNKGLWFQNAYSIDVADNEVAISGMTGIANYNSSHMSYYYNSIVSNHALIPAFMYDYYNETPTVAGKQDTRNGDISLGVGEGNISMFRNIFQNNAGGLAGWINDPNFSLESDNNNWWTTGTDVVDYNGTRYDFAGYQAASGYDPNSSNVEAMFMGPQDLRLTQVDANLYYTDQMLFGNQFMDYEENDLAGKARTKAYYKGAYSIYPTIEIATEPEDIVDCFGTIEHAFIVVANVDYNAELSYQWYKDGVAIFGETGPILYINDPLDYEMGAVYRCLIMGTGEADEVWTRPAMLYTLRPTEITRQPFNVRTDLGTVATFEIDMHIYEEAPSMYQPDIQWYRGGVMLSDNDRLAGTQSSIMTIRDVQADDLGDDYYVIISGLCGADTSEAIALSEIPSLIIEDLPSETSVCMGSDAGFQVVASSSVPGVTITYQWMKDGMELVDGPRVIGSNNDQLLISMVEAGDAGDYTCVVTLEGWDEQTTNATTLILKDKPMLTTDLEASVSVQTDKTLELMVEATGDDLMYQWYKDDVEIAGETNATYTKDNVTSDDEGTYKVKVYNDCGEQYSTECVVTVTPFVILGVDGEAGEFMLNQNIPNPFATTTRISFVMPEAGQARLAVTDASGKELSVIFDGTASAGLNEYNVEANTLNLTSGVYYYTLTVNGNSITKTMVVVK